MKLKPIFLLFLGAILVGCSSTPDHQWEKPRAPIQSQPKFVPPPPPDNRATQGLPAPKASEVPQKEIKARNEKERDIHLSLIARLVEQNKDYAALAHLDSFHQTWGMSEQSEQLQADALRKTRQFDEAEAIYVRLLANQTNSRAWYGLGRIQIDQGNLAGAIPSLEKAIENDPLFIDALSDLGLTHLLLNNRRPAYDTLMKAMQVSNEEPKILANLALWGLVYNDLSLARNLADKLNWDEATRSRLLSQASRIRERFKQGEVDAQNPDLPNENDDQATPSQASPVNPVGQPPAVPSSITPIGSPERARPVLR